MKDKYQEMAKNNWENPEYRAKQRKNNPWRKFIYTKNISPDFKPQ